MSDPSPHGPLAIACPTVAHPTALRWLPHRRELLVGTWTGELVRVDPALAECTVLASGLGAVAAIDVRGARCVVATGDGRLWVGSLTGAPTLLARHPFQGPMDVVLAENHVLLAGETQEARSVCVVSLGDGALTGQVRVPPRVAPSVGPDGRPILWRATPAGLEGIPMRRGARSLDLDATDHRLRVSGRHVVGFDRSTVCLWERQDGALPVTVRLPEVSATAVSSDGDTLGVGTEHGAVAVFPAAPLRSPPILVRAFRDPVTTVAFAPWGRWLATGAEVLRIWSW